VFNRNSVVNAVKNSFKPKTTVKCNKKESTILKCLLSGTALTVTVGLKNGNYFAHCEAETNRLITLRASDGKDTLKFDWWKFWSYLRPHILKLIGAILAALAVAYFNIQIPNFLGTLVNALARYAGADSGE
jgi:ATP-binding cassette subfamily B (MDR/TAP) protein 8